MMFDQTKAKIPRKHKEVITKRKGKKEKKKKKGKEKILL